MRIPFLIILALHSLIHLLGFAKAFGLASLPQLTKHITKPLGLAWLITTLLLAAAVVMLTLRNNLWWIPALAGVLISQILIVLSWQDARFGTVANVLILIVVIATLSGQRFEESFRQDVKELLSSTASQPDLLTEAELQHLPLPVRNYLRYTGVVGKQKVSGFYVSFEGEMRAKGKDFFPFVSEQYNRVDNPERLFFMEGRMFGVNIPGYHKYKEATASMHISLFGLLPLVKHTGEELNRTETVTLFNDMCLLAPGTLADPRITWVPMDEHTCKAVFRNQEISVSATLFFNEKGQLIDFLSPDRMEVSEMKNMVWSTPVSAYGTFNGVTIPSEAEAVWHYPEGKFTYGKFRLKHIQYETAGRITCA